ncbi:uncharacterized protein LOC135833746 [Planococcus citri]|uniref:uncharacterized protein LOC135833746 n=1 Tax=Planococcus citri TaxID=170843 RepID=UPI0031F975F1
MCVFFTLMLAIWRYIAIAHPLKARYWCTMKITQNAVMACYVTSVLLSLPLYFTLNIVSHNSTAENPLSYNSTAENPLHYTPLGQEKDDWFMYNMPNNSTAEKLLYYIPSARQEDDWFMYNITLIIKSVLQQLVPSVVLSIFSFRLMVALFTKGSTNELQRSRSNTQNNPRNAKMKQQADRLIMITLTVMVLFLITQIPLAAVNLIKLLLPNIHNKMDSDQQLCSIQYANLLSGSTFYYINMSVSFLVYYAMSENFRTTFLSLFNSGSINSQKKKVLRVITMRKTRTSPEEGNANRNTDQTIQSQTVNTFV